MVSEALLEERDERPRSALQVAVLERMDELRDEPETVRPGDEKPVEGGRAPAFTAGRAIRLIGRFADRADLRIGLRDEAEAALAGERPLASAAEAGDGEAAVRERHEEASEEASGG